MIVSTLPIHRRTRTERAVIAYLRGEAFAGKSRDLDVRFRRLRRIAARAGIEAMPPGSAYVSQNELMLLCWIAEAQREAGPDSVPDNRCLAAVVRRCAQALVVASLRLPPLTLYFSRFREAGGE